MYSLSLATMGTESRLGRAYRRIYDFLCGVKPHERPWHFQYLDGFFLHRRLRRLLPTLGGNVLDVGCGRKPYQSWFGPVRNYVGIDIYPSEGVDIVIAPEQAYPFRDNSFDVAICTQVLQSVSNPSHILGEIKRVLRPGGIVVVSHSFLYDEIHNDLWRFSAQGTRSLFAAWSNVRVERLGGFGSTAAVLFLHWVEATLNLNRPLRLLKAALLPMWLVVSLFCNMLGLFINLFDGTHKFYSNVLVLAHKPYEKYEGGISDAVATTARQHRDTVV